jgi:sulfite exporter TauE/SafE
MAISKNVAKVERVIRIILGIILILWGFSMGGFWRPASIVVGVLLLLTASMGY